MKKSPNLLRSYTQSTCKSLLAKGLLCSASALLMLTANSTEAFAEQTSSAHAETEKKQPTKTRKATPTLNIRLYEKLQQAMLLSEKGDPVAALEKLDKLKAKAARYNSHEQARLWLAYGNVYYALQDYNATISAYEKALLQKDVPAALYSNMLYNVAQVYFIEEHYQKALSALQQWLTHVANPSSEANVFIAQTYYQTHQINKAIPFVVKAIETSRAQGKAVKENWYLLLNAMYYQQKAYTKSFQVMLALVNDYPKKSYYLQLSSLYGELQQDFYQYSTQVAMYDGSLLNKSVELVSYAQFLLAHNRPYRSATVLKNGLAEGVIDRTEKNLQLLANAWMLARENDRVIPVLKEAASLSDKGELYLMLGQAYLNMDNWSDAVEAIQNAFTKGGIKRKDTAYLIRGMALFNLKKYDASLTAFDHAKKDKRSRKQAEQWSSYVKSERQRDQDLSAHKTS